MVEPLATYLHDHLAGANFAVELLKDLSEQAVDAEVARLSARLLVEVEEDRAVLQGVADSIGAQQSSVKEAAAWVAQKASRVKLTIGAPIGTFEAVEMLSLGVQGKRALWTALRETRLNDRRFDGLDLDELASRACEQFAQLEDVRLRLARSVFAKSQQ